MADGKVVELAAQGADALANLGKMFFYGRRSKTEKAYERSALDDMSRLQGGAGGMSQSKRQAATAEAMGQVDRAAQEGQRKMLRGANVGSGQAFAAQQAVLKQKGSAEAAALSDIRRQDLEEAERQRQAAYQKAALSESMRGARHERMIKATQGDDAREDGYSAGQMTRTLLG